MMLELDIVYEDDDLLVLYKSAGIAVQTQNIRQPDLVSQIKNYRAGKREAPYIGLIHRLDQPVEGILVFAKHKKAAAGLSQQMQERSIAKYYRAVVRQTEETKLMPGDKKALSDFLLQNKKSNISTVVPAQTAGAKKAELSYEVLQANNEAAILKIRLETGRHHQIRVQLAHAGTPIFGDKKYGGSVDRDTSMTDENLGLCSTHLEFEHPISKKKMVFDIEPRNPMFALDKTETVRLQ
ncbi:MAG: RluA family pseudouridine synthase [Lachnospiraceae bacterium]